MLAGMNTLYVKPVYEAQLRQILMDAGMLESEGQQKSSTGNI